ncbi:MAG TPA: recombinase family protein [Candidatus Pullilachnospira intestinigallinarum]|nr:recombinase family protein [Candidatus Pullilachnospira intestinigallinarum]
MQTPTTSNSSFTWIGFYEELANILQPYKDNRPALISRIREIYRKTGIRFPTLEKGGELRDINPFTVFGLFNKGISNATRMTLLEGIAEVFGITSEIPRNFDGIPVLNNWGATLKDIVATLNGKGYETPAAYYRRKHPGTKKYEKSSALSCWTMDNVRNILQQEMYYGAVVQHKRECIGVGSKHTRAVAKDKQIIVEGMHEPIISKEVFLQAQEIFYHWEDRKPAKARDFPLKGKVKCAVCGRRMNYRSNIVRGKAYSYFWCPLSKYQDGSQCSTEYIREADVNEVVCQSVRQVQLLADRAADRISKKKAGAADVHLKKMHELADLQRDLERCNTEKFANMDGFMAGIIGKDAFQRKRAELTEQESRLKEQIAVLEKQAQELKMEGSGETARAVEKIQSFSRAEELSVEIVQALVKEVRITDREHMEIRWNFKDEVMEFIES